jgi:hypothetical protein
LKTFKQRLSDILTDIPKPPPFERLQVEYDSALNVTFIWKREQQGTAVGGGCIARIKGKYDFDFIVIGEETPA